MWNIYLKVTIEKKWRTQNFLSFLSLKSLSPCQFLGSSSSCSYHWIFYNIYFERNYDVLKSKNLCFLLNKNINFNKNETKSEMENPTVLEKWTLVFSLYKNYKLKVKQWRVGARERKKSAFVTFILSEGFFFNVSVLSCVSS